MNANDRFYARDAQVDAAAIAPLPNSRKIHVQGSRPDLRVPMREITQSETPALFGAEANPPLVVYDTSGPYTDPTATIDIRKGLPALRAPWIAERDDTQSLPGPSSAFGRARLADPELATLRFDLARKPLGAKPARNVTQMHYARRGIVTPEMEFVAIRENLPAGADARHACRRWSPASIRARASAPRSPSSSPRSSSATRWRAAARSSRRTSTTRRASR